MIKTTTSDAYKLLHQGSLVMAEMEHNGICVDLEYVKSTQKKIRERVVFLTQKLKQDKIWATWQKAFPQKANIGSRSQLAHVLFEVMKIPCQSQTTTRQSADEEALDDLNLPFTKLYLQCEKLKKADKTYLTNIAKETVNGVIHPNFNLHLARSQRGSSDHPNFTNIPVRDPLIKKLIRRSFKPRIGHRIVDLDFKGSEINGACWYHKDPVMLNYVNDLKKDMHGDLACQIYRISKSQLTEDTRYCGKNMFIFPEFYGDWWMSCARNLWKAIDRMDLKTVKGTPLKQWLKKKGITTLGSGDSRNLTPKSFEAHLKNVEHDFWYNKFRIYQDWKDQWWSDYQTRGFFQMLSGFKVSGYINRKQCINWPIQGTSFHALLWCLIRISQLLKKYRMKTKLIGQIHDDAVSDTPDKELNNYIELALDVITVQLPKHWPWIITPMRVEIEVTPVDGSWYQKSTINI